MLHVCRDGSFYCELLGLNHIQDLNDNNDMKIILTIS